MKELVIFIILLILFIPVSFAKEISIPELFDISQENASVEVSGKEVYFYAGSKLVASDKNGLDYKYQDRLGSDVNSKALPFGQAIKFNERFSFTGKELDSDLYYFNARYYDSNLGKFTSVDPIKDNPAYSYVSNNPMNYVDPTGKTKNAVIVANLDQWGQGTEEAYSPILSSIGYNTKIIDIKNSFSFDELKGISGVDLLIVAQDYYNDPEKSSNYFGVPPADFFNKGAQALFLMSSEKSLHGMVYAPTERFMAQKSSVENTLRNTLNVPFQVGGPFLSASDGILGPKMSTPGRNSFSYSIKPKNSDEVFMALMNPNLDYFILKTQQTEHFYDRSVSLTYYKSWRVEQTDPLLETIRFSSTWDQTLFHRGDPEFQDLYNLMGQYAKDNPELSTFGMRLNIK